MADTKAWFLIEANWFTCKMIVLYSMHSWLRGTGRQTNHTPAVQMEQTKGSVWNTYICRLFKVCIQQNLEKTKWNCVFCFRLKAVLLFNWPTFMLVLDFHYLWVKPNLFEVSYALPIRIYLSRLDWICHNIYFASQILVWLDFFSLLSWLLLVSLPICCLMLIVRLEDFCVPSGSLARTEQDQNFTLKCKAPENQIA